ncbi:MAG: cupredoxin domain-containing protein [Chloroflexi bacterium]|nr:cupredoxin domain-containing protein [Chloroflexota bacterium]
MGHRIRTELGVLAALAVAIAALVLAVRAEGSGPVAVVQERTDVTSEGALLEFVPKGAREIAIVQFAYDPDPVRVLAGTPVAWLNQDRTPHTVTARDGSWDSNLMAKGDIYTLTFDQPGVYTYICTLHPPSYAGIVGAADGEIFAGGGGRGMQGTIIVQ